MPTATGMRAPGSDQSDELNAEHFIPVWSEYFIILTRILECS